ncbi:MAG: ribulose-phosphate 3-epimerase [Odoribacteraceae bacterium]|jgi:ribulose-phosphate 3-epimerase|nr:ribulose-phosphate 3-epimerase [Odoribacteraceae bacterium]
MGTSKRAPLVAPSLLGADFLRLGEEVEMVNESAAGWLHLDVMDGVFVPNLSFGLPVVEHVKRVARKPLDVHLMIARGECYVEAFRAAGADVLTVHAEAVTHLHRVVEKIKETGALAGVALNPGTPLVVLEEVLPLLDVVLLMSVNPGFGGQRFIESSVDKVARLRQMIDGRGCKALIEVDGGVTVETGRRLVAAGAEVLVAGSFVFRSPAPSRSINELKECNAWKQ